MSDFQLPAEPPHLHPPAARYALSLRENTFNLYKNILIISEKTRKILKMHVKLIINLSHHKFLKMFGSILFCIFARVKSFTRAYVGAETLFF